MAYDRDRYQRDQDDRDRYDRNRQRRDERGMLDRAGDEVRSWFGDDEAQRRRERDERESEPWTREDRWRREGYRDYGDRYGRSYAAPLERNRFSSAEPYDRDRPFAGATSSRDYDRGPAFQPYARGSQEFGP